MRVIAGEFRSRRLKPVPGHGTRPTSDRLRETLFNVLATRIGGVTFLDAYAGTGAVGIEAVSRGAAKAIFIEKARDAAAVLEENVRALGIESRTRVLRGSVHLLLPRHPADIVFVDPPYESEKEYALVMDALAEMKPELVIVQHHAKFRLRDAIGEMRASRVIKHGDNCLTFFPGARESE